MTTRHLRRWLAGLAAALLMLAAPIGTAWGHSTEIGTTPADGDVLDSAPTQVSVEFDSDLLDMGATVVVRDAAGESIVTGPPEVGRRTLAVPVDGAAGPGVYRVAYRVVSEDGHTIESTFAYTVAGSPGSPPAGASGPASSSPAASPVPAEADASIPLPGIVAGGALVLILAIGGALALRR